MAARRQPTRNSPATPRTIWRGAITFGLVHVPVVLHPATRLHTLDLDLIDRRDYAAVGYRHYNKTTGKEVDRQDIVKADKWKPRDYKDTYRDDLLSRIRRKVRAGRTHALSEPVAAEQSPRPTAEIIDLAALLKKSLRGGKTQSGSRASRRPHHTGSRGRYQERRRA